MVLSLLLSTFLTVFIAELGDKTQLATLTISGTSNKPLAVFLGSSSALVFASLLGALTGGSISSFVPEVVLKSIASITFFIIGIRLFINSFAIDKEEKDIRLEVDGGVNLQNLQKIASAGADTFVAGSAIFKSEKSLHTIEHHANYIIRKGSHELGRRTLEGSRPGMALLVYSGLKIISKSGYELLINLGIEKAKTFASILTRVQRLSVRPENGQNWTGKLMSVIMLWRLR